MNYSEVTVLKKENEFVKLELVKTKAEFEKSKKQLNFSKFKNDAFMKELDR